MHWLLFCIAFGSFLIYAVAIKTLFLREHGVDPRMKVMKTIGTISAVVQLWRISIETDIHPLAAAAALLAYATALAVFFSAKRAIGQYRLSLAFSPDPPQWLLREGVFGYVRHPFYLSYSLTWLAGVVASPSAWTVVTTGSMLLAYWWAARVEEVKFGASRLAADYDHYRTQTGMFWPKLLRSWRIFDNAERR